MKRVLWTALIIGLATPIWALQPKKAIDPAQMPAPVETSAPKPKDNRIDRLNNFFKAHHCPEPYYTNDYITSADKYNIPYTLLPAISIIESQCGRHQLYDNFWGYWSDTKGFENVAQGVDYVSAQLATGQFYKNKTLKQKLKTYNSANPDYYNEITSLMYQMAR